MLSVLDLNAGAPNRGVRALAALCGSLGEARVYDVRGAGELPPNEGAWVLSGGPGSPLEPGAWREPLGAALRERVRRGMPTLAVCYGFELLGWALGAELRPLKLARLGVWPLSATGAGREDPLLAGLDGAGTYENRRWGMFGGGGVVLAEGEEGDNVVVRYGAHVVGTIFHPEADAEAIRGMLAVDLGAEVDLRYGAGTALRMGALGVGAIHRRVVPTWVAAVDAAGWAR